MRHPALSERVSDVAIAERETGHRADSAYGSAESLAWLVKQKITPHIPVFDKSNRADGTSSRADFVFDAKSDRYTVHLKFFAHRE
jgi:hypothetical protein